MGGKQCRQKNRGDKLYFSHDKTAIRRAHVLPI
jgi:hypothetical protein